MTRTMDCPVCGQDVVVTDRIATHTAADGEECVASRTQVAPPRIDWCIDPVDSWHGRTDGPVTVYCAMTLVPVGRTDGTVQHDRDGRYLCSFRGQGVVAMRASNGSRWLVLWPA